MLGVSREASGDDVRKAYRRLARQHHPDANPDAPEAEERFKEIQQAYEVLSNPEKRQKHDERFRASSRKARIARLLGVNLDRLSGLLSEAVGVRARVTFKSGEPGTPNANGLGTVPPAGEYKKPPIPPKPPIPRKPPKLPRRA